MLSSILISLFFAVGLGAWAFSKVRERTGGNTQTDIAATATIGVIGFLVFYTILHFMLHVK